jgi:lysosomal Pro-X carboxypeptidase
MKQVFANMAMMNYPYEENFIENLPAWPVKAACSYFEGATDPDKDFYEEFKNAS